jgi:hypothetical protein
VSVSEASVASRGVARGGSLAYTLIKVAVRPWEWMGPKRPSVVIVVIGTLHFPLSDVSGIPPTSVFRSVVAIILTALYD